MDGGLLAIKKAPMFDLLDTLAGTVKPDYRSPAAIAYRQSKPAAYYDRQCKVRKIKPNEYPAKPLGPKELPSVEALIAGAKINAYGQIHSCGWYLGDSCAPAWGDPYFGDRGAKTLEDCMVRFHAAVLEKRASFAQRVGLEKEVAAYMKPRKPIDPMFCTFDTLESISEAIKAGMPTDKVNKHRHKEWGSVVAVEREGKWTLASGSMIPMEFADWRIWNGSEWNVPTATKESVIGTNFSAWRPYDLPKGADWIGVVEGVEMAWKELKYSNGSESDSVALYKGDKIDLHYSDPICIDGTRLAIDMIKKVLGKVLHVEIAWNISRGNHGHKVRANGMEWFIMTQRFTENVARPA